MPVEILGLIVAALVQQAATKSGSGATGLDRFLLLVPAAALTVSALALLLNAYQAYLTQRQTRAGLVATGLKEFMNDPDIQHVFYLIEYGRFSVDETFYGSQTERQIDKLLRLFSNLGLLYQGGLLSIRDLMPLKYYVVRVYRDPGVQQYLSLTRDVAAKAKIGQHPYGAFSVMAREIEKT